MKLTKADREYIRRNFHENDAAIAQIERAIGKTIFTADDGNGERRISCAAAMDILGREAFLSGMDRAAFHWSAVRTNSDESIVVYFDASKFFKEE